MQESAAHDLGARLDELGLRLPRGFDLAEVEPNEPTRITLAHRRGSAQYTLVHSPQLTASALLPLARATAGEPRTIAFGTRVTERSAQMLREAGIDYLDRAGNAHIDFEGVHIEVTGRRSPAAPGAAGRSPAVHRGGTNLFSPKRAQVIFALLTWSTLGGAPLRDIARASGVSLGQAAQTLDLLDEYGFIDASRAVVPRRADELVDSWTAAYPRGLGSPGRVRRFSGDTDGLESPGGALYVSGESAVPDLLTPETLTLYARELPTALIREHRWRRDEQAPNILIRTLFWRDPDVEPEGVGAAPPLLVYADLLASGDARQREAAAQFRRGRDGLAAR